MGLRQNLEMVNEIVQRFRAGKMDEKEVKELEKQTGEPAERYIREAEELLEKVQYSIATLTITELRGITKRPNEIPQTQRQLYVKYNNVSTYEDFIAAAKKRLDEFDEDRENRKKRGAIAKLKRYERENARASIVKKDLEERGIVKKELDGVWEMDFCRRQEYRKSHQQVYVLLYDTFSRNPREVHTMPETEVEERWFYVSVKEGKLRASETTKKKKNLSLISEEIELRREKTEEMVNLYQMYRRGYRLKRELTPEEEVWLGVLKFTRTPMYA